MATFIDGSEEEQEQPSLEVFEEPQEEQEEAQPVQEAQAEEPQEDEEEVPEKYRGKSIKDVIRMHQEVEKAFGKKGAEIGELKRMMQEFVQAQTVAKQAPDVEEDVDIAEDPEKYVRQQIERHPKVKQAELLAAQLKKAEALANLKSAHPDFQDITNDESFKDWIMASKVRQNLYLQADTRYDFESANELLSLWKERNEIISQRKQVGESERKQSIKAASTGTAKASAEPRSKKIYRHADIENLNLRDPERYMALQPEIMAAYAEGRVRR